MKGRLSGLKDSAMSKAKGVFSDVTESLDEGAGRVKEQADSVSEGVFVVAGAVSEKAELACDTVVSAKDSVKMSVKKSSALTVNAISKSYDDLELKVGRMASSAGNLTLTVGLGAAATALTVVVGGPIVTVSLMALFTLFDSFIFFSVLESESEKKHKHAEFTKQLTRIKAGLERFGVVCETLRFCNEQLSIDFDAETGEMQAKYLGSDDKWIAFEEVDQELFDVLYSHKHTLPETKQALELVASAYEFEIKNREVYE